MQGSVLEPFLFNLFINDFLYDMQHSKVCNFADDNTIYACGQGLDSDSVISNNEKDMKIAIIDWYQDNQMVPNPEKLQIMFLDVKDDLKLCIDISGNAVHMLICVHLHIPYQGNLTVADDGFWVVIMPFIRCR